MGRLYDRLHAAPCRAVQLLPRRIGDTLPKSTWLFYIRRASWSNVNGRVMNRLRAVVLLVAALAVAGRIGPAKAAATEDEAIIVHVLNRIGYGPRQGDVEKVRAMGVRAYIDRQLHPDGVTDQDM